MLVDLGLLIGQDRNGITCRQDYQIQDVLESIVNFSGGMALAN